MKHITNDKGDIGVLKITADLVEKGYPVFTPISATCPFDLLIEKDGFKRVQVKYRNVSKQGTLDVHLTRAIITNNKITSRKNDEVDILAVYCPQTNACYYIYTNQFSESISLRVNAPKNGQTTNIRFAENYKEL